MNQTSEGWRKRQIALDKKADNARELGLDYNKTIMEMAREAGDATTDARGRETFVFDCYGLEAFAAMVRHDERARCISHVYGQAGSDNVAERTVKAIRSGK